MSSELLATAATIARDLAGSAVWFDGRCSWMGALPGDERRPLGSRRTYAALGPDLYDGTSGVAIFLAEAAAALDDDRLRATAIGAIRHATTHADRVGTGGLHEGRLGIAYAAARVAACTGSEAAREDARVVVGGWREPGGALDVSDGAAGAALALLALAGPLEEPGLLERAGALGDVLIARANRSAAGWSWGQRRRPRPVRLRPRRRRDRPRAVRALARDRRGPVSRCVRARLRLRAGVVRALRRRVARPARHRPRGGLGRPGARARLVVPRGARDRAVAAARAASRRRPGARAHARGRRQPARHGRLLALPRRRRRRRRAPVRGRDRSGARDRRARHGRGATSRAGCPTATRPASSWGSPGSACSTCGSPTPPSPRR